MYNPSYIYLMNVYQLLEVLEQIEDKTKEVFFDATPIYSESFVFKSVDVVEDVEDDTGREMIILSCGTQPSAGDRINMN